MPRPQTLRAELPPEQRQRYEQTLQRMDRFARIMDSQFRVPGTRFRFGLDPIIGLVPVFGDLIGFIIGSSLLVEGWRVKVGKRVLLRMLFNNLLELIIGIVPIFGDLFDAHWKANTRNTVLLRRHIESQLYPPPPPKRPWLLYSLLGMLVAMVVFYMVMVFGS